MSYLQFKGVNDYGDFTITDEIQYGLQTYFEWGFLNIGAFENVENPIRPEIQAITGANPIPNWGKFSFYLQGTGIPFDCRNYGMSGITYVSGIFRDVFGSGNEPTISVGSYPLGLKFEFNRGIFIGQDLAEMTTVDDSLYTPNNGNIPFNLNVVSAGDGDSVPAQYELIIPAYSASAEVGWININGQDINFETMVGSTIPIAPAIPSNPSGEWFIQQSTPSSFLFNEFNSPYITGNSLTLDINLCKVNVSSTRPIYTIQNGRNYDSDAHILRPVPNPNYTTARVWEGYRNNWVWESGLSCSTQPIEISGIYVNNTFQPTTGVGSYAFNIDYPNGRIIFDSPIAATSTVICEYSYKRIKFTNSDSLEGRALHHRSLELDDQFIQYSGTKVEFERNKLQLPAVAIEMIPKKRFPKGTQLGGGHYLEQSLLMHIFAETPQERNKILDIIVNQHDSNIVIYDMNKLAEDNMFPINLDGNIVNQSTRNYNNLVGVDSSYGYRQGIFKNIESQEQNILAGNLFGGIAKVVIELGIPNV